MASGLISPNCQPYSKLRSYACIGPRIMIQSRVLLLTIQKVVQRSYQRTVLEMNMAGAMKGSEIIWVGRSEREFGGRENLFRWCQVDPRGNRERRVSRLLHLHTCAGWAHLGDAAAAQSLCVTDTVCTDRWHVAETGGQR